MIPGDLKYTKSHEWARIEGDTAVVGITDFAQEQLGDITFVDLPALGAGLTEGAELGSIESVKAASDLYSPVTGEVSAVNEALASEPELVNREPYGRGWLVKVKLAAAPENLLSAGDYEAVAASDH
ncbi:MAG: glycine cleavage system protein GcvH [Desulfovibrionaceae bacterium]|nr:glycine cleavage system protein GcvH [Desulfovibrionaceae bacterium]MBF0513328.1 glycine cleavage system protein GcvH [Desulfovibrionaceae bacterium]